MTNILILCAGTRNKIIQYFKRALKGGGRVIATDSQATAPALYEADGFYVVPRISNPGYIDIILDICKKEDISGVLSLIDPELSLLAKNNSRFEEIGVKVIGSSYELCERALDKMKMYEWLSAHGYRCAKSYSDLKKFYDDLDKGLISFPVIVKPVLGSASIEINEASDSETVDFLMKHYDGLFIQQRLNGCEIGADCYIDMLSGELVSVFTKRKILMRAGETDKSVSFKDEKLFDFIEKFVKESGWRGQIDIDLFEVGGEYYISEINPRFGGGYPHAYECGCDSMTMIVNNLNGVKNERKAGSYEENVVMMKYSEVLIRKE